MGCVNPGPSEGDMDLPVVTDLEYEYAGKLPQQCYVIACINKANIALAVDTGASKSLLSIDTWKKIKRQGSLELCPESNVFSAVNGSEMKNFGSVTLKTLLYGAKRNLECYMTFYVVENLTIEAILGLDQINRHSIKIDIRNGSCVHPEAGMLILKSVFQDSWSGHMVSVKEETQVFPFATVMMPVEMDGVPLQGEGMVEPVNMLVTHGLLAYKVVMDMGNLVACVTNPGNTVIILEKGEKFGEAWI